MHDAVKEMLKKYQMETLQERKNALKEIIQEIALLGLWRAKFFEKGAFYGGTALRILHGLDRFSEDLDFSLLKKDFSFSLAPYEKAVQEELQAFGFEVWIEKKRKEPEATIASAFIKANTIQHLFKIDLPEKQKHECPLEEKLKIKFEVDIDPPSFFATEAQPLLLPAPFSVICYSLPDLYSGKIHAMLYRNWERRVKGRDWYDFLWFLAKEIPLNLTHLQERMIESNHLKKEETFNRDKLLEKIHDKIDKVDFDLAKRDILPFVRDPRKLEIWSPAFFHSVLTKIKILDPNGNTTTYHDTRLS